MDLSVLEDLYQFCSVHGRKLIEDKYFFQHIWAFIIFQFKLVTFKIYNKTPVSIYISQPPCSTVTCITFEEVPIFICTTISQHVMLVKTSTSLVYIQLEYLQESFKAIKTLLAYYQVNL